MPAGRWDVDYPGLPGSITLPPLAIRWLGRQGIPEEGLRKLRHDLGGSFLVSRDKVQEELKLTEEQKEKLEQHLRELLPDAMQFFQKIEGLKPEEREKELGRIPPEDAGETGSDAEGNPERRPAHAPAPARAATGGASGRGRSGKTCKSRTSNGSNSWR